MYEAQYPEWAPNTCVGRENPCLVLAVCLWKRSCSVRRSSSWFSSTNKSQNESEKSHVCQNMICEVNLLLTFASLYLFGRQKAFRSWVQGQELTATTSSAGRLSHLSLPSHIHSGVEYCLKNITNVILRLFFQMFKFLSERFLKKHCMQSQMLKI